MVQINRNSLADLVTEIHSNKKIPIKDLVSDIYNLTTEFIKIKFSILYRFIKPLELKTIEFIYNSLKAKYFQNET